ncbi:diguanylate cyclase [Desulfofustis glycolicus]|uniref:Diguanylate cyclase with PAS/PAC sensor n=1 Tax=Desulfofustis glycolicus DSM 9705 TaxID=1121409 RepID=A0A1M5YKP3_9BACT|nr:diguanylate cyclase [Desulfofustis glycolicus]SHI12552.1 diguanylate cyclase with PAS/PAC sensor [Desulfofustis glycolicus DSM 9705]
MMKLDQSSYARIIDNLHDGLYFVDADRIITYWNKAAERITGYRAAEVIGKSCADNILTHVDSEGCVLCLGTCPLAATINDGKEREAEVFLHHKNGHRVPVLVRVNSLVDEQGRVIGGIELFTDLSSIQVNQQRIAELEQLALLDGLTRLANRVYLEREIDNRLHEFDRLAVPFGLLFLDIDHFKQFNDTYGHAVGDEVLKAVAQTFVVNSRPFDLFGRWGGEEFIGIIRNITGKDLLYQAERMRLLIERNYLIQNDQKLQVTVSIGATVIRPGDTMETLVKRADELLYESKDNGRNRVTLG